MPTLHRHPLLPALAAALLSQAVLIGLLRPSPSPGAARPTASGPANQPADDTPELLRLSRNLLQSSTTPNPAINQLLTLPLPPPPQLAPTPAPPPARSQPAPCPAKDQAPPAPRASPATPQPSVQDAAARPAGSPRADPAAPPTADLPGQPGQALDLARAIALGLQSLPAQGASPAQVALQRRQWWLSGQDSAMLQRAWEQAEAAEAPESWNALPAGVQLRRLERQALGPLAGGEPSGRTLVDREQITLLWGAGARLWLLRLSLPGS